MKHEAIFIIIVCVICQGQPIQLINSEDEFNHYLKKAGKEGNKLVVLYFTSSTQSECMLSYYTDLASDGEYNSVVFLHGDFEDLGNLATESTISRSYVKKPTFLMQNLDGIKHILVTTENEQLKTTIDRYKN